LCCSDRRESRREGFGDPGATGKGIKLLSTVCLDADLLAHTHVLGPARATPRYLEDWCKELNNQLLGRVKNKLLDLGCEIGLGLPALVTGSDLALAIVIEPGHETREHCFGSAHGPIALALTAWVAPGLALEVACSPEDGVVMHAGGILF
jgi:hypothetical protein